MNQEELQRLTEQISRDYFKRPFLHEVKINRRMTTTGGRYHLDDHHIEYTDRDIKSENPTAEEIAAWYPQSGKDLKAFFNTSGLIYREQQLKDKLPGLSEEEKLALLASNGMLVKRPILVLEDKVLVGFKEKEWMEALNL